MTEIEQLRKDIETLEAAEGVFRRKYGQDYKQYNTELARMRKRLAKLEAEAAAKADPWAQEKESVAKLCEPEIRPFPALTPEETRRIRASHAARYVKHLQDRVAEFEKQLASEKQQVDNVDAMAYVFSNDLKKAQARIAELEAELAKRPVTWVAKKSTGSLFMGYDEPMIFASKKQAAHLMNCLNLMPQVFDVEPYTGQQK